MTKLFLYSTVYQKMCKVNHFQSSSLLYESKKTIHSDITTHCTSVDCATCLQICI